jgi:hypothetical protein
MCYDDIYTPDDFIARVKDGVRKAPMAIRLSPHILSVINWSDPLNDPVRRQFVPLAHPLNIDHPISALDPLKETQYSPVPGLVHRYPDRALFLGEFSPSLGVILGNDRNQQHPSALYTVVSVLAPIPWVRKRNRSTRHVSFLSRSGGSLAFLTLSNRPQSKMYSSPAEMHTSLKHRSSDISASGSSPSRTSSVSASPPKVLQYRHRA